MHDDDFECFLSQIYTPLKCIELLSNTINYECNENWDFLLYDRKHGQELLSFVFAIKICAIYILNARQNSINTLYKNDL